MLLVAWEGLSVAEAAVVLGCPGGTAAVRLHRARKRLRRALSEDDAPTLASLAPVEER
jgi:RNA polymerase sigma-70 factor (ECF subfamily)